MLLLEDKFFFSTATALKELPPNYSEHVRFRSRHFFRTAGFLEEKLLLGSGVS